MSDMTVFGPEPTDPVHVSIPNQTEPPAASMLINVTFRVDLRSPAASQPDEQVTGFARSVMVNAVEHEMGRLRDSGASLNGDVQVTATLTRL